jgi:hypothetical protein
MVTKVNSNGTVAKCTQRKAAAEKYVPATGTIPVHAQPYTQQQVEAIYQAPLDARQNLVNLRGQVAAALAARKQADAAMSTFDAGLKDWVSTTFGPTSQASQDFGYARKQAAKPSVATKAEAQAKAEATRKARGTKGPKAKLKVTGNPPAAPATPQAPATPSKQ